MNQGGKPVISIIIPVLNEGDRIVSLLEHIRAVQGDIRPEIIVVDGDAGGSTVGRIKDSSVKKIVSPRGRAVQMNRGALAAHGEIILFLHADTFLPRAALMEIQNTMSDGEYAGGAFDLGIDNPGRYFRLVEKLAALRYRITNIPFGDQAVFLNREYFFKIGGFRERPLMEDVDLMRRIKKRGDRIFIIPLKTKTSSRKWEEDGIIYGTIRNWLLQIMFSAGVPPEKLVKYYYRKKKGLSK